MYQSSTLLNNIFKYDHPTPLKSARLYLDLETTDDEKLLHYIKTGSPHRSKQAYSIIYNRYYLDVWRLIKSKVHTPEHTQDIFLDVWEIAINSLANFEWRDKSLKSWLMTTARNKIIDYFRHQKREEKIFSNHRSTTINSNGHYNLNHNLHTETLDFIIQALQLDSDPFNTPPSIIQAEADRKLQTALTHLKEEAHQIITLIYYKQKNSAQIAQILNLKPATVRKKHQRALKQLRKLLTKKDGSK